MWHSEVKKTPTASHIEELDANMVNGSEDMMRDIGEYSFKKLMCTILYEVAKKSRYIGGPWFYTIVICVKTS